MSFQAQLVTLHKDIDHIAAILYDFIMKRLRTRSQQDRLESDYKIVMKKRESLNDTSLSAFHIIDFYLDPELLVNLSSLIPEEEDFLSFFSLLFGLLIFPAPKETSLLIEKTSRILVESKFSTASSIYVLYIMMQSVRPNYIDERRSVFLLILKIFEESPESISILINKFLGEPERVISDVRLLFPDKKQRFETLIRITKVLESSGFNAHEHKIAIMVEECSSSATSRNEDKVKLIREVAKEIVENVSESDYEIDYKSVAFDNLDKESNEGKIFSLVRTNNVGSLLELLEDKSLNGAKVDKDGIIKLARFLVLKTTEGRFEYPELMEILRVESGEVLENALLVIKGLLEKSVIVDQSKKIVVIGMENEMKDGIVVEEEVKNFMKMLERI